MSKLPHIKDIDISAWLDGEWDGEDAQMQAHLQASPEAQMQVDAWRQQGLGLKQVVSDLASQKDSVWAITRVRDSITQRQQRPLHRFMRVLDIRPKLLWGVVVALLIGVLSAPLWVYLWVNFIDGSVVREDTTVVKGETRALPADQPVQFEIKSQTEK